MEIEDIKSVALTQLPGKIYDDIAHPAAVVVGKAVADIFRFVALPFTFLGMSAEQLTEKYRAFIEKAVKKTPVEKTKSPDPAIVGPLLESVKYIFEEDELVELFNNLLSSAINKDREEIIHPAFTYIIRQLSNEDAQILNALYKDAGGTTHIPYSTIEVRAKKGGYVCGRNLTGFSFLNVEKNISPNISDRSIKYLISLGLLKLESQKRYTKEDYFSIVKSHYECRKQWNNRIKPHYRYKPELSPCLDNFLKTAYRKGGVYPNKDEYNLIPIEDPKYEFCDIEINQFVEDALNDLYPLIVIEKDPLNAYYYLLPQRGYLSFTEMGLNFMKCCTNQ